MSHKIIKVPFESSSTVSYLNYVVTKGVYVAVCEIFELCSN